MTDTLTEPLTDQSVQEPVDPPELRPTQCRFCDFEAKTLTARKSHERNKHGDKDAPPASVTVNIGSKGAVKTKNPELDALEQKAKRVIEFVSVGMVIIGQQGDALDISKMADEWAKAVRELGEHEEWLRKLAAGGEQSARAMAWVKLGLVTLAMLTPILIRHEVLKGELAQVLGTVMQVAPGGVGPVAQPAAA